jgi:hypothetical protein
MDPTPYLIEAWKATVEVQKHFNDIGLRIRSLALTALTFILGGTAFAYLNSPLIQFADRVAISPAAVLPLIGVPLWAAFWIIDVRWYHRLLRGAVAEGEALETLLVEKGVNVSLAAKIKEASQYPNGKKKADGTANTPRKASRRLNAFYWCGIIALAMAVAFALIAGCATELSA